MMDLPFFAIFVCKAGCTLAFMDKFCHRFALRNVVFEPQFYSQANLNKPFYGLILLQALRLVNILFPIVEHLA
jgi:hypothetical protein